MDLLEKDNLPPPGWPRTGAIRALQTLIPGGGIIIFSRVCFGKTTHSKPSHSCTSPSIILLIVSLLFWLPTLTDITDITVVCSSPYLYMPVSFIVDPVRPCEFCTQAPSLWLCVHIRGEHFIRIDTQYSPRLEFVGLFGCKRGAVLHVLASLLHPFFTFSFLNLNLSKHALDTQLQIYWQ